MYRLLQQYHEVLADQVVDFTRALVQIPSPSLQEADISDRITQELKRVHFDAVHQDDYGNVLGILYGRRDKPVLLLQAHMDTVPVQNEKWDVSPYAGTIEDGQLFGAGASDCKSGIAQNVYAALLLKRAGLPLDGSIVVAATVAEENGCSVGLRRLLTDTLPALHLNPTYAILGEPTHLQLYYGHDGWADFEVQLTHGSPFQVHDAVEVASEQIQHTLLGCQKNIDENWMESFIPSYHGISETDQAVIRFSLQIPPSQTMETVRDTIRKKVANAIDRVSDVAMDVRIVEQEQCLYTGQKVRVSSYTPGWELDPYHPLMERARQALQGAKLPTQPGKWHFRQPRMGTPGSTLLNEFNIPTIGYGPGSEEKAHTTNESVSCANIRRGVLGTAVIAHNLVGVPVFGWTSDEI